MSQSLPVGETRLVGTTIHVPRFLLSDCACVSPGQPQSRVTALRDHELLN